MEYYSPALFRALNGVFCLYKPAGKSNNQVLNAIKINLARELNKLPCRPIRLERISIRDEKLLNNDNPIPQINPINNCSLENINSAENKFSIQKVDNETITKSNGSVLVPDLSDHPLVTGPKYLVEDFNLFSANSLKTFSSGVTLVGISNGTSIIKPIVAANWMRVYHVSGRLGIATQDFTPNGRIIEQSTYGHVNRERIDRVIAGIQAGHQKYMYTAANVDLQTEEAYKLACKGLLRPINPKYGPVIYGIKCIHFNPPDFIIEVHAINETCGYLTKLTHELGLELRTNAVCTQLRRVRYGEFTLQRSLLFPKHTAAKFLVDNIEANRSLLDDIYHAENIRNLPNFDIGSSGVVAQVGSDLDIECIVDTQVVVDVADNLESEQLKLN